MLVTVHGIVNAPRSWHFFTKDFVVMALQHWTFLERSWLTFSFFLTRFFIHLACPCILSRASTNGRSTNNIFSTAKDYSNLPSSFSKPLRERRRGPRKGFILFGLLFRVACLGSFIYCLLTVPIFHLLHRGIYHDFSIPSHYRQAMPFIFRILNYIAW